jgi:acyl-coenzyme A thioesterase PaaI-like protein
VLALLRQARASGDYAPLTAAIPYARFLGLRLQQVNGELLCHLPYQDMLIGNSALPALHGGTLGALLESAAIFELMVQADTDHVPKIISLTVDYLRSGKAQDTFARAVITRAGRRVANVRVEAWQEDRARPIAAAHVLFLLAR